MPGATRRMGAMRWSPPPRWRCGSKALERDGLAINPARIEGGSANNVVPDHAVLRFNIRPREHELADAFDTRSRHTDCQHRARA